MSGLFHPVLFGQVNIGPFHSKTELDHEVNHSPKLKALFPGKIILSTPLDPTTKKILALKLFAALILTLGLALLSSQFRLCLSLFSKNISLVVLDPPLKKDLRLSPNTLSRTSTPVSQSAFSPIKGPLRLDITQNSSPDSFETARSIGALDSPAEACGDDELGSFTPVLQEASRIRRLLNSSLDVCGPESPRLLCSSSPNTPGLPSDRVRSSSFTPVFNMAFLGSLVESPRHMQQKLIELKPSTELADLLNLSSNETTSCDLLDPSLHGPTRDLLESFQIIKSHFKELSQHEACELENFWSQAQMLPVPLSLERFDLEELEELLLGDSMELSDLDFDKLGYYITSYTDPIRRKCVGHDISQKCEFLVLTAQALGLLESTWLQDVQDFQTSLETYLSLGHENESFQDVAIEPYLRDCGLKAKSWLIKIKHASDYKLKQLFCDLLQLKKEFDHIDDDKLNFEFARSLKQFMEKWTPNA